jgi:hypothetical protein
MIYKLPLSPAFGPREKINPKSPLTLFTKRGENYTNSIFNSLFNAWAIF